MNKVKLSEIATVELSSIDKKIAQNEIPVKLCNFTDVYYNWAITEDIISSCMKGSVKETELNKFTLKKGQVAITKDSETRDDIGMPCYISDSFDNAVLGYHCALITPNNNKLNGKYLNALLNTEYARKCFENQASGSGQRYTLSKEAIESIQIPLPSLDEQKRIGSFFSNIDKKIQNNKRQIEILESIAKTIYDYWFVQFDFPNEDGKPYKSSGGKMVWNEELKREIPEGWIVRTLNDLLLVSKDRIASNEIEDRVYVPIEAIPRNKMSFSETSDIDKAATGLCSFEEKAILFSNRRVYFHKVSISPFKGVTRDTVIIMYPKNKSNLGYAFQIVNSDHYIEYATKNSYGTEQPVLATPTALSYKYACPITGLEIIYSKKVAKIIDKVLEMEREIKVLTTLRNFLNPLLVNGQVTLQ